MPQGVDESLHEYARMWAERGIRAWAEGWWAMPGSTGDVLCDILGAAARLDRDAPERRR